MVNPSAFAEQLQGDSWLSYQTFYRNPSTGLYHSPASLGIRYAGDMVLDPTAGSGGIAEAAWDLNRRFIVIDREQSAFDIMVERMKGVVKDAWHPRMLKRGTHEPVRINVMDMTDLERREYGESPEWSWWDSGDCFIVKGDSISVLRTMPDSFVGLVYSDPPFMAQKEFRNKSMGNIGFSDIWAWDDEAESRLAELQMFADLKIGGVPNVSMIASYIPMVRDAMEGGMASYLSWIALLLIELHRISGSTEYIKQPFWEVRYD